MVDFATYVFVPAYAIAAGAILPPPFALPAGALIVITGAIYFPNNAISYAGGSSTGSQCTQIVADTIQFTDGSTFNSNCTSTGTQTLNATNGTLVM